MKRLWPIVMYYLGIYLKWLEKITKVFCVGRVLKLGPAEYEAGALTTQTHFRKCFLRFIPVL